MSTFIKDFIERETVSRRNFLLASAAGLTTAAMGLSTALALFTLTLVMLVMAGIS